LVFQKHDVGAVRLPPPATIIRCHDFVGEALEDYLDGTRVDKKAYSIYDVTQEDFSASEWVLLPSAEATLRRRLRSLRKLDEFAVARQGIVSGADPIFVRREQEIDPHDRRIYAPFLPDRLIQRYRVPRETGLRVFYPFIGAEKISVDQLQSDFPGTWDYLLSHRHELELRSPVRRGDVQWWEPAWPRSPRDMLRPKVVTPNLVLIPRFAIDETGKYVVSRSPFLVPREQAGGDDLLFYLAGILNTSISYWYIASQSPKFRSGYAKFEARTLSALPIPDPSSNPSLASKLVTEVRRLVGSRSARVEDRGIEEMVADMYELTAVEREALGIGRTYAED
jgi:hypothetical protein